MIQFRSRNKQSWEDSTWLLILLLQYLEAVALSWMKIGSKSELAV
jgi:hypothetical protein